MASLMPRTPSVATAPPTDATVRKSRLPLFNVSVIASSLVNRSNAGIGKSLAASPTSGKAWGHPHRGSQLVLFGRPLAAIAQAVVDLRSSWSAPDSGAHQAKVVGVISEFRLVERRGLAWSILQVEPGSRYAEL